MSGKMFRLTLVSLLPLALLAGCAGNGGKYFQNDGPPKVGGEFKAIMSKDVTIRVEEPHKWANRRYKVMGKYYTPVTGDQPMVQTGTASWYGKQFHGKKTAIGETYDMFSMTAAHPTMELPSFAKVTNLSNGRSVIVRVNDRGPFLGGRIIDMSYAAAVKLGYHNQGTARVKVERITRKQIAAGNIPRASDTNAILAVVDKVVVAGNGATSKKQIAPAVAVKQVVELIDPLADLIEQTQKNTPPEAVENYAQAESQAKQKLLELQNAVQNVQAAEQKLEQLKQAQDDLINNTLTTVAPKGWTIQIGSYASEINANEAAAHAEMMLSKLGKKLPVSVHKDKDKYRVVVADESNADVARELAQTIGQLLGIQAFCLQL